MTDPIDAAADAEWHAATAAAPAKCLCGHDEDGHALSTGRCRSVACGCTRHRPREVKARTPQPEPTPEVRRTVNLELVLCPECDGSGQMWESDEPSWRTYNWCPACFGTGAVSS